MIRFYLTVRIGSGTFDDKYRPKYFSDMDTDNANMPYGREDVYLVCCPNITQEQHDSVKDMPDVITFPEDIDQNLTQSAVDTGKDALEYFYMPADWLTTSFTYREVLRIISGCFQFLQRYKGLGGGQLFLSGVNLNTRFNQLPIDIRNRLIETAQSFGYDYSSVSNQSTLRYILKYMADQWGEQPIILGGVSI